MWARRWPRSRACSSRAAVFHGFVPCEGNPRTFFAALRHSRRLPIHRWKRDHIGHIQILTTARVGGDLDRRGLTVRDLTYSFHLLGQIHDLVDYWRREQLAGAAPGHAASSGGWCGGQPGRLLAHLAAGLLGELAAPRPLGGRRPPHGAPGNKRNEQPRRDAARGAPSAST